MCIGTWRRHCANKWMTGLSMFNYYIWSITFMRPYLATISVKCSSVSAARIHINFFCCFVSHLILCMLKAKRGSKQTAYTHINQITHVTYTNHSPSAHVFGAKTRFLSHHTNNNNELICIYNREIVGRNKSWISRLPLLSPPPFTLFIFKFFKWIQKSKSQNLLL